MNMSQKPANDGTDGADGNATSDPAYWNGTLLKCLTCRLKFPFSAADHPFEFREPGTHPSAVAPHTPTTRCPQCDGWVPIAGRQR